MRRGETASLAVTRLHQTYVHTIYALTFAVFAIQQPSAKVSPRDNLDQVEQRSLYDYGNFDCAAKSHPPPRQWSTPIGP